MKRWVPVTLAVLAAVFLSGCFKCREEITLNLDGSGTSEVHIEMSKTAIDMTPDVGSIEDAKRDMKEAERPEGVKLVSGEVTEESDGDRIYDMKLKFTDFETAVADDGIGMFFVPGESYFEVGDESWEFRSVQDMDAPSDVAAGMIEVTHVVHFPGKVTETNGELGDDGKTVTWVYPEYGETLSAKGEVPTTPFNWVLGIILGVIGVIFCLVIVVAIVAVILLLLKRKKKSAGPRDVGDVYE